MTITLQSKIKVRLYKENLFGPKLLPQRKSHYSKPNVIQFPSKFEEIMGLFGCSKKHAKEYNLSLTKLQKLRKARRNFFFFFLLKSPTYIYNFALINFLQ